MLHDAYWRHDGATAYHQPIQYIDAMKLLCQYSEQFQYNLRKIIIEGRSKSDAQSQIHATEGGVGEAMQFCQQFFLREDVKASK